MRRAKLGAAVVILTSLAACTDPAPTAGTVQPVPVDAAPTPASTPEASTTTTPPEPEPEPTTTTTAYDWGPVLCPAQRHPRHHEPCPVPSAASTPSRTSSARTVPIAERPAGSTPPEYVKQCESGGDYAAVNPNGHYGAWQFSQSTWESVGGTGRPDQASPAEQDRRAAILWANGAGASHWACA